MDNSARQQLLDRTIQLYKQSFTSEVNNVSIEQNQLAELIRSLAMRQNRKAKAVGYKTLNIISKKCLILQG